PIVQLGLRLALVQPIELGIVEQLAVTERNMNPDMLIVAAGFKQEHAVAAGFSEAIGEHAASRSGAGDYVIEPRLVPNRHHGPLPACSLPALVSITFLRPRAAGEGTILRCFAASMVPLSRFAGQELYEEFCVNKFGVGQPVPRVEDPRFITGRGRYVDDIELPQQCYGVAVMSPHAHARIKRVDTAKAKTAPGALAVLPAADVAADKLGGLAPPMPGG